MRTFDQRGGDIRLGMTGQRARSGAELGGRVEDDGEQRYPGIHLNGEPDHDQR